MPTRRGDVYPLPSFHFAVEIGGIEQGYFTECSGLQGEVEVFSYEEGGCNNFIHKLPGRTKFSNITLKRGFTYSDELWIWFQGVVEGVFERKNLSVKLMDNAGNEIKRWNVFSAYPVKYVCPTLNTGQNEVIIETIELTHEGMSLT